MAGKRYPIGKILYILSNKKQKVVPAIVVEENHKKTRKADGTFHELMNYKVTFGPSAHERATIDLHRIDGEVYESLEELQKVLRDRLEAFLSDLVVETKKQVMEWYGVSADSEVVEAADSLEGEGGKLDPDEILNGKSVVTEAAPVGAHPLQIQGGAQATTLTQPNLRDHIKRMVTPMEELTSVGPTEGRRKVKLETGEEVYVDW
jgi:hypothetical protein